MKISKYTWHSWFLNTECTTFYMGSSSFNLLFCILPLYQETLLAFQDLPPGCVFDESLVSWLDLLQRAERFLKSVTIRLVLSSNNALSTVNLNIIVIKG